MADEAAGFRPRARYLAIASVLVALAVLIAVSAGGSSPGAKARPISKSGALRVVQADQPAVLGVYAGGRRIRARGLRVAAATAPAVTPAPVVTPLLGYETPVAVPSPDGRAVAYNTWRWTRSIDWNRAPSSQGVKVGDPIAAPEVFVRDLGSGRDVSLGAGTMSVAYRPDGAIAYARGESSYRFDKAFTRHIEVRETLTADPVSWTSEPAGYSVVAWATGGRLLAHRDISGVEAYDVVVLDGPGRTRTLAQAAEVVAVSPSGKSVVVSSGDPLSGTTTALQLIDIGTGAIAASIDVPQISDPVTGAQVAFADDPGDWQGDELVVRTDSGLLVLQATDEKLSTLQVLHLEADGIPLNEPRFANSDRTVIEAWANLPESRRATVRYQCNRLTLVCARSAPVGVARFGRPAYDRSPDGRRTP